MAIVAGLTLSLFISITKNNFRFLTPRLPPSVCTTWIVTRNKLWYLIDVWRQRVDYPALKASVQTLAERWDARRVLVEDTGAGTSLVQELRGQVSGIVAVKPDRHRPPASG
jgi:phage terminase large subunit-like protein